ncbi:hypothetical protein COCC4DRAFT_50547 [Bipolaris maydis ATCC 48331]|uniref:DUF676 domain-containing protein n=2 Tax=Cochliobolus heterostrophus TaxID=5016 RepID=M2TRJ2_COCH5|nr:uncharacterized protein COCC4DRAFT_50547 [Bipolaris maydis ATCC 48331]EMD89149.1 hypothetical protein COCHEDRAFT_1180431 [Bipolaris maydis C5]KAJ5020617.1 putative serine esterase-domain-containing protein [Bipolaris maydis]ENI05131.1 hypothetical protein COCC4DRAFT_50547 [Bipolaris maydis ATCC 48331]KAJ5024812.1 putative serine esterase-domain-containing protein [Bipolaris maydis]KAJ5057030.1 putative serine esterase-domain-containing protein [Bipolaris maydis]
MLLTPRTYSNAQTADAGRKLPEPSFFVCTKSRKELQAEEKRALRMLLLHQKGAVKVGEVVRYTLTYTPSEDRILPPPPILHVRIRNSSAIPLRAAYLHGPYTIHVSAYPSTFNPNVKNDDAKIYGTPDFEPNLKAGGYWNTKLTVPEHARTEIPGYNAEPKSVTWIIEIASQIIFSNSASVNYELLVARDERSLDLGFTAVTGNTHGTPGKVQDHQQGSQKHVSNHAGQPKGVYSKAVKLVVDDTTSLWNKPELPEWKDEEVSSEGQSKDTDHAKELAERKRKNIHLVIVTHGLHSNLGADMLYLKESIDATARQARESRRQRRKEKGGDGTKAAGKNTSTAPLSGGQDEISDAEDEDEENEEEVVVRGFDGNVIRTERGIQYLGKRLAKYILRLTYPDQPYLPIKRTVGQKLSNTFSPTRDKADEGVPAHQGSSVHHLFKGRDKRAYQFTSISFIGHSLGGLVQTYALAYIHKHSPHFFDTIKPVNFIALASPFLGLSNENPTYVKFALDFGLVGRTGQDLGLTWRAPTLARSGWTAMGNVFGTQGQASQQEDPGAKPLLRILPTGPAHQVLRRFRNRTVYSNVVNDGIVPLRTSCLLFLDWRGLGRVQKARRENGLIGTVAVWGYGQLTGQNSSPNPSRVGFAEDESSGADSPTFQGDDTAVPLPGADTTNQEDETQVPTVETAAHQLIEGQKKSPDGKDPNDNYFQPQNTLMQWWSYIRPTGKHTSRDKKMFSRSQTIYKDDEDEQSPTQAEDSSSSSRTDPQRKRPRATRGDSIVDNPQSNMAPPKTTIFESAGDLINPPVPPHSWINDPTTRARAIFHDRIYHPEDIPPPPLKKRATRNFSGDSVASQASTTSVDDSVMRVEEKIARAYHKDLSWRKVLVSLEPDAHNNIIVRRMFANAYGWPVIKHLCDTHFADTYSANTRNELEPAVERAEPMDKAIDKNGERVKGQQNQQPPVERSDSEMREVADELAPLHPLTLKMPKRSNTTDSMHSIGSGDWDSIYFNETSDDEDEFDDRNAVQRFFQPNSAKSPRSPGFPPKTPDGKGTSQADIADFLGGSNVEVHRGLGASPKSKTAPTLTAEPDSIEPGEFAAANEEGQQASTYSETPMGRLSGVGLRNAADVSASPEGSKASLGGSSVTEQVARLSSPKADKQDDASS